jgi:hypothetical protein
MVFVGAMISVSRLLLLVCISLAVLPLNWSALTVSMSKRSNHASDNGLTLIAFCVDCDNPFHEGAAAKGLHPKHGLQNFHTIGTLVYCVPNNAEARKVLNAHHFKNRIVLIDRGNMGLLDKVDKIQDSEAVGIIIADDGRCKEDFSYCGPQAGSAREGGFAINDNIQRWRDVEIPVVIVSQRTAELLRLTMGVRTVEIPKLGVQNITIFHHGKEQFRDELRV